MAELEDDEELPDADDDDNDDDDPNDDDDEYDEPYADEDGFETPNHVSGQVTGMVTSVSVSGTSASATGSANPSSETGTSSRHMHYPYHHSRNMGSGHGIHGSSRRKTWDDEHVLKRKFSALIPAFDPRPGRTNVNQTSDFDIAPPPATGLPNLNTEDINSSESSNKTTTLQSSTQSYLNAKSTPDRETGSATPLSGQSSAVYTPVQGTQQPRLSLSLRGPNLPGIPDVEIELSSPTASSNLLNSSCASNDRTIFQAVQSLVQLSTMGSKADKIRRIWEPTYVIVYRATDSRPKSQSTLEESNSKSPNETADSIDKISSQTASSTISSNLPQLPLLTTSHCSMDEVLQLLRQLYIISTQTPKGYLEKEHCEGYTEDDRALGMHSITDLFTAQKITNKLVQQIQDPLVLSANAMPDWCQDLTFSCPMLFPFDTRLLHFQCTAFGASRSIVWLQNQRDQNAERTRGGGLGMGVGRGPGFGGRDDFHEFRVGRIKHERVKVPRGDCILDWAIQVIKAHAERKAILEVEFLGEEGTGLGPTLEFFALTAAELQRKDLAMWICDDNEIRTESEKHQEAENVQPGGGSSAVKPPDYYVNREAGLFPAPLAQDGALCSKVADLFWFLGAFLAKTLQDNRLVDLPLSQSFLKILCQGEISSMVRKRAHQPASVNINSDNDALAPTQVGGTTFDDYDVMTSSTMSILSEAESDLDTSGGSVRGQNRLSPSPGMNDWKNSQTTEAWYSHILSIDDLAEVDPPRGKFLLSLQELVTKKQAIQASHEFSTEVTFYYEVF